MESNRLVSRSCVRRKLVLPTPTTSHDARDPADCCPEFGAQRNHLMESASLASRLISYNHFWGASNPPIAEWTLPAVGVARSVTCCGNIRHARNTELVTLA
jgi:hypothetical protein